VVRVIEICALLLYQGKRDRAGDHFALLALALGCEFKVREPQYVIVRHEMAVSILVADGLAMVGCCDSLAELAAHVSGFKPRHRNSFGDVEPVCFAPKLVERPDCGLSVLENGGKDVQHGELKLAVCQEHFRYQPPFLREPLKRD